MYIIARPQYYLTDQGTQYTRGYDQTTVVGHGRTLRTAANRAGYWATANGYRVYDRATGEDLGRLEIVDLRGSGPKRDRFAYVLHPLNQQVEA